MKNSFSTITSLIIISSFSVVFFSFATVAADEVCTPNAIHNTPKDVWAAMTWVYGHCVCSQGSIKGTQWRESSYCHNPCDNPVPNTCENGELVRQTGVPCTCTQDGAVANPDNAGGATPDTTPPIITLNGTSPITITVGDSFTDPGATADGGEQVTAQSTVNTAAEGDYIITYTATDAAGNTATKGRRVIVEAAGTIVGDDDAVRSDSTSGGSTSSGTYIFENPLKYDSIGELILALINGITLILMPIIVFSIAYIGFRMVWAGREKNADYNKWKNAFAWSLAGLFLVLGARGILYVIQNTVKDVLGDEYAEYIGDPTGDSLDN